MILPLRQRHRRMFIVIGLLLPIAFVAGIAARRATPIVVSLPGELAISSTQFPTPLEARTDLFATAPIVVHLLRGSVGDQFGVRLSAVADFVKPDLLVYWVAGNPAATEILPANAVLLGAFSSSELALPTEAATTQGVLILFSLADQEVVAISKPLQLTDSTR